METVTKTVEIEGEEREVEVEVNPDELGFLTKDDFKQRLSEEVAKARNAERQKAEGKYALDEIADDEELLAELRERNPDVFAMDDGEDEDGMLTEEDLDRFRQKWERKDLEPVRDERDQLSNEVETLRVEKLNREVLEAASEMGFRDDPGVRRGLRLIVREEMGYSDEDAEWYKQNGDSFEVSTAEDSDSRYVTVREFLREMADSGDYDSWIASDTKGGTGYGGAGDGDTASGWPATKVEFSDKQKRDFISEEGVAAWEALPYD